MDDLNISRIIKKRSDPGILLFSMTKTLLYANREAKALLPEIKQSPKKRTSALDVIYRLCDAVRGGKRSHTGSGNPHSAVIENNAGPPRSVSAFLMKAGKGEHAHYHIMVLVERVIVRRTVDIDQAKKEFGLTDRQADVVALICEGLTNKELSSKLGIGEYTVKDHIKKIMRKTGASSRTGIVARLR